MRRDEMKGILNRVGPAGFVEIIGLLLEGRDETGKEIRKHRAEEFPLRALWEATVGPCEQTLPSQRSPGRFNYIEMQEALESTVFPSATGMLIASRIIEGYYGLEGAIGDQLVTVMQSRLKSERIVGFTSLEGPKEVPEGMPYEESSFAEKYVTTETAKKGRILEITEEAIFHDQTGQILLRASRLGEATRQERELIILGGIVDVAGAADLVANGIKYRSVYRPNGTAAALYSATNKNLAAGPIQLVDWTDLDEVFQYHATTVRDDRARTDEQLPIIWMPKVLLVARKLWGTAARIANAITVRSGDITAGTGMQFDTANPLGTLAPGLKPLSSPLLDYLASLSGSQYNDSSDWFIGDPKAQFIWQEIWPLQTFRARQDDEAQFRRDVVARFKARYYGGIAALDTVQLIKVNAA